VDRLPEIDTRTLAIVQTADPDDWVAQGSLTGGVYDPVNVALMDHEFGTSEITWRFLGVNGGYRVAGPIYANQDFIDVEQMFAIATAGTIITHEGSVLLEPGQAKSVVATITDADLLAGSVVSLQPRLPVRSRTASGSTPSSAATSSRPSNGTTMRPRCCATPT
jgi:hypothetical protein